MTLCHLKSSECSYLRTWWRLNWGGKPKYKYIFILNWHLTSLNKIFHLPSSHYITGYLSCNQTVCSMDDNELDNIKILVCPFLYNNFYSIGLGISMYWLKKHQVLTIYWDFYIIMEIHRSQRSPILKTKGKYLHKLRVESSGDVILTLWAKSEGKAGRGFSSV